MILTELNQPGIIVLAGILSAGIVGPVIFEGTVSGEKYLEQLKTHRAGIKRTVRIQQPVLPTRLSPTPFCNGCPKFPEWDVTRCMDRQTRRYRRPYRISSTITRLNAHEVSAESSRTSCIERSQEVLKIFSNFSLTLFDHFDYDLCTTICRNDVSRYRECIEADSLQFEH